MARRKLLRGVVLFLHVTEATSALLGTIKTGRRIRKMSGKFTQQGHVAHHLAGRIYVITHAALYRLSCKHRSQLEDVKRTPGS